MSGDARLLRELLARGLADLGEEVGPAPERAGRLERLARLAEMVADWTGRVDLTAHRTPEAVARRLVLDSLALARAAPPFGSLADLGSGAGFPGLPIAIWRADRAVTLVEARERRHHFQRAVVRELGLGNVRPLRGRAEELDATAHTAVVAQAVVRPERALAWMLPWAEPGGALLLPGGEIPPELPSIPEVSESTVVSYQVPLDGPRRTLWIGRRRAD